MCAAACLSSPECVNNKLTRSWWPATIASRVDAYVGYIETASYK